MHPSIFDESLSNKRVHLVPTSAEASAALGALMPHLYYHNMSETGLESFSVVAPGDGDEGAGLASAPVAAVPFHPGRQVFHYCIIEKSL